MICETFRGDGLHVSDDILDIFWEAQELARHLSARRGPLPTLDDYEMSCDASWHFSLERMRDLRQTGEDCEADLFSMLFERMQEEEP